MRNEIGDYSKIIMRQKNFNFSLTEALHLRLIAKAQFLLTYLTNINV